MKRIEKQNAVTFLSQIISIAGNDFSPLESGLLFAFAKISDEKNQTDDGCFFIRTMIFYKKLDGELKNLNSSFSLSNSYENERTAISDLTELKDFMKKSSEISKIMKRNPYIKELMNLLKSDEKDILKTTLNFN